MFWFPRNRKPSPPKTLSPDRERELTTRIEIVNSCRRVGRTWVCQFNEEWSQRNREMIRGNLRRIREMGKAATDRLPLEFFDDDYPVPYGPFSVITRRARNKLRVLNSARFDSFSSPGRQPALPSPCKRASKIPFAHTHPSPHCLGVVAWNSGHRAWIGNCS